MKYGIAQRKQDGEPVTVKYRNWLCRGYLTANNLFQAKKAARRFRRECAAFASGKGIDPGPIEWVRI